MSGAEVNAEKGTATTTTNVSEQQLELVITPSIQVAETDQDSNGGKEDQHDQDQDDTHNIFKDNDVESKDMKEDDDYQSDVEEAARSSSSSSSSSSRSSSRSSSSSESSDDDQDGDDDDGLQKSDSERNRMQLLVRIWFSFSKSDRNFLRNISDKRIKDVRRDPAALLADGSWHRPEKTEGAAVEVKTAERSEKVAIEAEKAGKETEKAGKETEKAAKETEKDWWKIRTNNLVENIQHRAADKHNQKLGETKTVETKLDDSHHHHHHHHKHHHKHHSMIGLHRYREQVKKKYDEVVGKGAEERKLRAKEITQQLRRQYSQQSSSAGSSSAGSLTAPTDKAAAMLGISDDERIEISRRMTSNASGLRNDLTEEEKDGIAVKIMENQDIVNQAFNGNCISRLQARLYPYLLSPNSKRTKVTESFIMALVVLNVVIMVITTEDSWFNDVGPGTEVVLNLIEYSSFGIFSFEYLIRLWLCTLDKKYFESGPILGRLHYVISYNALIDFVALIPSIIEINECVKLMNNGESCSAAGMGAGGALRLWRIVRILKLEHYSNAFSTLKGGFTKQAALIRLVLIYPSVAWVIFATLLSYTETLENGADEFTAEYFSSIPRALFPTLLMMSGEMPLVDFTPLGMVVVSLLALFSLVIMATATGILASGFEVAMREQENDSKIYQQTFRELRRLIKMNTQKNREEKKKELRATKRLKKTQSTLDMVKSLKL